MLNRVLLSIMFVIFFIIAKIKAKAQGPSAKDFLTESTKELPPPSAAIHTKENPIVAAFEQGRGHLYKRKRILKHMYPILMAVVFAKLVVVPLILKALIATTSSAFVMSKIALVTSALMALSWLLGLTTERAKLQIVQYPASGSKKFYGGWNVKDKYTPHYGAIDNDWTYDGNGGENNDKSFFL